MACRDCRYLSRLRLPLIRKSWLPPYSNARHKFSITRIVEQSLPVIYEIKTPHKINALYNERAVITTLGPFVRAIMHLANISRWNISLRIANTKVFGRWGASWANLRASDVRSRDTFQLRVPFAETEKQCGHFYLFYEPSSTYIFRRNSNVSKEFHPAINCIPSEGSEGMDYGFANVFVKNYV